MDKLFNKHTIKVIHYLFDIDYNNFQDLMYLGLKYTWVQFSWAIKTYCVKPFFGALQYVDPQIIGLTISEMG